MSYNRNYHKSYSSYDYYGQGNYRNNNNYQRNYHNYNSNYQRDYYEYNNNYQRNNYYNEPYQNNNSYYNQNYSRGGYRGFATEDNRQNFDNYYLNKKKISIITIKIKINKNIKNMKVTKIQQKKK